MTIMNDRVMLEKFKRTIFPVNMLTPATLTMFKHYIEKYLPIDGWAQGSAPNYQQLAQEVIEALYGYAEMAIPLPTSQITEKSLMKGYNVEMLTYVDGVCVDHMADDEIVERIAAIESDIKALSKIEAKSKAIKAQQAKMAETINLLVQFLDARFEEAGE